MPDRVREGLGAEERVTLWREAGTDGPLHERPNDVWREDDPVYEVAEFVPASSLADLQAENEGLREAAQEVVEAWQQQTPGVARVGIAITVLHRALAAARPEEVAREQPNTEEYVADLQAERDAALEHKDVAIALHEREFERAERAEEALGGLVSATSSCPDGGMHHDEILQRWWNERAVPALRDAREALAHPEEKG